MKPEEQSPRVIAWFSCGAASAVAAWLTLKDHPGALVCRTRIPSEHCDNERFAADCERWYGKKLTYVQSDRFVTPQQVWEARKYIAGINGAPCTSILKKEARFAFQRVDDIHILGYTADEPKRMARFRHENPEINVRFPLADANLVKADVYAILEDAGIQLPRMYRLGFDNNNCIGCPKGGAGYWNMIRKHFPDAFAEMAERSRRLGARLVKQDGERIFLDELRPETGRQKDEIEISCSPWCEAVIA